MTESPESSALSPRATRKGLELSPVTVITGHYGVGKTNLALNVALDAASSGLDVTLVDLDVVNPYFRASEYRTVLEENGVKLVAPAFAEAGTNLDVPALTGSIRPAIDSAYSDETGTRCTIIDAGGDDVGATALGRFADAIKAGPYQMWYVVNGYRNLTPHAADAIGVLEDIKQASRLEPTGVVNNSHLQDETTLEDISLSIPFGFRVAHLAGVPLVCITFPEHFLDFLGGEGQSEVEEMFPVGETFYPVKVYVKPPWKS